jgi:phospholipase C
MKNFLYLALAVLSTTAPAFATVTVTSPTPGSTDPSPVHYVATATATTCAKGVASMGVYVNNKLIYVVNAATLNTSITMANGAEHTVVQEWDYCGGSTYTTVDITVGTLPPPTVTMTANPLTVTAGTSSKLTVSATGATTVTVSGSDGSIYHLAATGGAQTVTPTATTTYTAEVSGSTGNASQTSTVTVIPATSLNAVSHVIFMLQENRSFDHYFGMLNPYRHANGLYLGDDGKDYEVDGIDDKLTTISNQDDQGTSYPLFKLKSTCVDDESSSWLESYGDVNRWDFSTTRAINMDGFVHIAEGYANSCLSSGLCEGQYTDTTGERAMGYYDQGFLNYYYYMASEFAISDRWFSPVSSKSIPNRIATFTGGTTQGLVFDPGSNDHLPQLTINNIFQELDGSKVSWKIYYTTTLDLCLASNPCTTTNPNGNYPDTTFSILSYSYKYMYQNPSKAACTGTTQPSSVVGDPTNSFCVDPNHIAPLSQYYKDLTNGTLPSFAFIESGSGVNDEHPGSSNSILSGQTEVAAIVAALIKSTSWKNTVFFLSYDEGGGPYDHVPPVPNHSNQYTDASLGPIPDISSIAVNPDTYKPCLPAGGTPTLHCDLVSGDPGTKSTDAAYVSGYAAQLGFRVPNIVISPFTRRHYVSHTPMDHTAILKFVENRFLGSSAHLTARDAAQSNLLEFFDFTKIPWSTPPTPPTPVSATSLGYDPCTPTSMGP